MKECYICEAKDNLNEHHIDWHHDNDDPSNVVTVCARCHSWLHKIGYMSLEEMLEVRKKVLSYRNDPFAPKRGSNRLLFCIHCGSVLGENEVKWDSEMEIWRCKNHPDCDGAGIGFDLIPKDEIGENGLQPRIL